MNIALLIAAGFCLLIACVHTFVGTRTDLGPMLAADVPEPAKSTLYYCWHMVSFVLFAMSALFLWSGLRPAEPSPALIAAGFSTAFCLWGGVAAVMRRQSPLTALPQGLMFAVLTGISVWGLTQAGGS